MSNLRVLIVGASIAGPTAAYWFAKAGASVTIIERFPKLRPGGQNVDIRTAGVTVMRKMTGMEAAVRANLIDMEGICFVNPEGQRFATMRASGNPDQQTLVSEYEIYRGDLARVLFDLTKDDENIKYVFGEQVASLQHRQDDGPMTVEFANGLPTAEYDLVVACDGATSRTRAIGFACGVRDHIIPINTWAAYFSIKKDLLAGSKLGHGYSAVGGRFVALGPHADRGSRVTMLCVHPRGKVDATLPFREAQEKGAEALKEYVAQRYGGMGWKVDDILDGLRESEQFYASEIVQVKMPSIHRGRFVLVGDAGYAPGPTGAGTSLAMTGAYVLAGEIASNPGDVAAGLRGYEERMAPIIKDMQKIPPGAPGVIAPQTMWGIRIRNIVFRVVCWGAALGSRFKWIGSFLGRWASSFGGDKYGLPDYGWADPGKKAL